ncbi:hypothetical protein PsYK624_080190 [Phanerochaete sordida]|uniref:Uncharacterized protein n=1 Tax=Phanerochaete sordida TaxID=48140 RepID=A0A9P3GBJ7_9APHY|nr:hypothetical protein PsYK624_080190 [Phanerochaete sordida]
MVLQPVLITPSFRLLGPGPTVDPVELQGRFDRPALSDAASDTSSSVPSLTSDSSDSSSMPSLESIRSPNASPAQNPPNVSPQHQVVLRHRLNAADELVATMEMENSHCHIVPVSKLALDSTFGSGGLHMFLCREGVPLTGTVVGFVSNKNFLSTSNLPLPKVDLAVTPIRFADLLACRDLKVRLHPEETVPESVLTVSPLVSFERQQPSNDLLPFFSFAKFSNIYDAPYGVLHSADRLTRMESTALNEGDVVVVYFQIVKDGSIKFLLHHIIRLYVAGDPALNNIAHITGNEFLV